MCVFSQNNQKDEKLLGFSHCKVFVSNTVFCYCKFYSDVWCKSQFFFSGHLEVVKLLASHHANVKCKDKQGYTPLHAAAVSGQLDIIKYLLRVVSEVNIS